MCFGRDHGLGTGTLVTAPHSVHFNGRAGPEVFKRHAVLFTARIFQADLAEEFLDRETELVPHLGDFFRHVDDAVVETGQGHLAVFIVQAGNDRGDDVVRVLSRATIGAGMQVAAGRLDDDLVADHAAQHDGNSRCFSVPHAGVAHERKVAGKFVLVGFKERMKRRRTRLFLTFEQDRHVDRQVAGFFEIGAGRFDEGHQLALVVGGTAGNDDLAAVRLCLDGRVERVALPQVQRIDRLNVVVAVEQDMRSRLAGLAVTDNHRMAGRVAYRCFNADVVQFSCQPFSGLTARSLESRVGGNALDLEEVEQSVEAVVEIGIDARQDLVDGTHDGSLNFEQIGAGPMDSGNVRRP